MNILHTAAEMRAWSENERRTGATIGFVPTMGALHQGHASLITASVADCTRTVLSVFVNPTQFAPNEDYSRYPRTWEDDRTLAQSLGVDAIYVPEAKDMYPDNYATYVAVEGLTSRLCGASRPLFFRGVTTVVTKLFNAVQPHRAYFGQKDAQQAAVIQRMTRDLDFGIDIVVMPIVRESDGLAMSSRNRYLNPEERQRALSISRGLGEAQRLLDAGERDPHQILATVRNALKDMKVDYIELVNADEITSLTEISGRVLLAVAAWVGDTRLIDNLIFETPESSPRKES